ncbi:MAG: nucleotidyltransferase family protein [Erysipelothrix sp.]
MNRIVCLIEDNDEIMGILRIIENKELKQGCLCAGTIRNYIWDTLCHHQSEIISDVDVVFFDPSVSYEETLKIQETLMSEYPQYDWEVKNECYMHLYNGYREPFISVQEAIGAFPETCTAIAARICEGEVEVIAPHGVEDLLNLVISPTPEYKKGLDKHEVFLKRVKTKKWEEKWKKLVILP